MFVVDASVAASWFLVDERSTYADAVLERLRVSGAMVPVIWPAEMANIFLVAECRGRMTEAQTVRSLELLNDLPIRVAGPDSITWIGAIISLARARALSAYDASYLQLAIQQGLPLATQDERLRTAARDAGVALA